jgi:hypothetical protein
MIAACLSLMKASLAMRLFHGGKSLPHFTSSEPMFSDGSHPNKDDLVRPEAGSGRFSP